jgi:pSer/pThr/pTyr-binding forkhead associated (FHA) protein
LPVAVVFLLRAVVLILLWGFVIAAIVAVRNDIFGARPAKVRPPKPARPAAAPKPAPAAKPAKRTRASSRATPTRLTIVGGPKQGTSVALSSLPVTIGRAKDSTVVIDDDYASNNHARLVPSGKTWMLEDLGSTNGTLLGTSKVSAPVAVKVGDRITIGRSVLEVQA